MTESLSRRMFDSGVRTEQMLWLGGMGDTPPSEFQEFVEDDLADCSEILDKFPWLRDLLGEGMGADEIVGEFGFRGIDGFFVQLATPIPSNFFGDHGSYSCSWGCYRTKWFFCSTLEEIVDQAEIWQKSVVETARAKAALKN